MSQRADCEGEVIKDALKKEFTEETEFCGKVCYQLLIKFNSICVGILSYNFGVIN